MAKARPSYPSIRARQRNILEGLGSKRVTFSQAADEFGVTPRQLEKFLTSKPKQLRKSYNRSPVARKLYESGTRPQVRETLNLRGVSRFQYRPSQIEVYRITPGLRERPDAIVRQEIGNLIGNLYYKAYRPQYVWAAYAWEHQLPRSIRAIRSLYLEDELSRDDYDNAVALWREIYDPSPGIIALYEEVD